MGMDVYGSAPIAEAGEYFRANVWYWHPLWDYCLEVAEVANKVEYGHSNDGDGLNHEDAQELGRILREEIASGRTLAYQQQYEAELASLPLHDCSVCNGSGEFMPDDKFTEQHSQLASMGLPVIDLPTEPTTCHRCGGVGKVANFATNYPFDVEVVKEFAEFCMSSGGFSIC